jgi:hypothetical protein
VNQRIGRTLEQSGIRSVRHCRRRRRVLDALFTSSLIGGYGLLAVLACRAVLLERHRPVPAQRRNQVRRHITHRSGHDGAWR